MKTFVKDPDSTLDYMIDWSLWIDDDTIFTSEWEVVDVGINIIPGSDSFTAEGITKVFISGGTAKGSYRLKNTITTNQGRIDERTIVIEIRDK